MGRSLSIRDGCSDASLSWSVQEHVGKAEQGKDVGTKELLVSQHLQTSVIPSIATVRCCTVPDTLYALREELYNDQRLSLGRLRLWCVA